MKARIKVNISEERTVKDKVGYFFYVYQGWLITAILTALFIGSLMFSILAKKESVLTVRVLSNDISYQNDVQALEEKYAMLLQLEEKEVVDIKNLDLKETYNQDLFVAQLVAKEVDLILLTEEMDNEMQPLFENNEIRKGEITYQLKNGKKLISRIPTDIPHYDNLNKIAK